MTKREYIEEPDYAKMPDGQASSISWDNHKRFNRSIIVELFQGQFKSTVRCLTCQHKSVKFDAFTFLTLPIPSSGRTQLRVGLLLSLFCIILVHESLFNCCLFFPPHPKPFHHHFTCWSNSSINVFIKLRPRVWQLGCPIARGNQFLVRATMIYRRVARLGKFKL